MSSHILDFSSQTLQQQLRASARIADAVSHLLLSSCFNGGTCVDGINSFSCLCPVGFTGPFCLHDINECSSNPCLNSGTCVDGLGTYRCTCPLGYTGKNCQVINFPPAHPAPHCSRGLCLVSRQDERLKREDCASQVVPEVSLSHLLES